MKHQSILDNIFTHEEGSWGNRNVVLQNDFKHNMQGNLKRKISKENGYKADTYSQNYIEKAGIFKTH